MTNYGVRNIIDMWKNIYVQSVKRLLRNIKIRQLRLGYAVVLVIWYGQVAKITLRAERGLKKTTQLISEGLFLKKLKINFLKHIKKVLINLERNRLIGKVGYV